MEFKKQTVPESHDIIAYGLNRISITKTSKFKCFTVHDFQMI